MKNVLLLITCVFVASFSSLKAEDKISHRLLVTDYGGNRVCIVAASGEIEWEYPATTPQDCWLLANGNVLFSQINGAVEVTRDKKVVWQYTAPPQAKVHSCQPLPDGSVLVAECFMSRLVIVGRDGRVVKELPVKSTPKVMSHQFRGVRRLEYEPILNTMARLRTGQTFASTGKLDAADYAPYFDRPTVYDVIDRRVASISATQALFLMNHPQAARDLAGKVVNRLKIDASTTLPDVLTRIYETLLQRPPCDDERAFAQTFTERRRAQTGASKPRDEISEFVTLILCGNEIFYLE
jgi:hypothetical protein